MTMTQLSRDRIAVNRATVRRRQILLGLVGLALLAALLAIGTGSAAAWAVLALLVVTAVAYLMVIHRSRAAAFERGLAALRGSGEQQSDPFRTIRLAAERGPESDVAAAVATRPTSRGQLWPLARFAASYAAGWVLSPLVFALTIAFGRTPKDAAGQRWLANIQSAQERLRDQSLRTLAISAATTASVTAAGSVAVFGGAGMASAAPIAASTSVATNAGAGNSAASHYVVSGGDTLWAIAERFSTTVSALASANRIGDPNLIYAGQSLVIPGGTGSAAGYAAPTGPAPPGTYTVRAGDTLWGIAARFDTTVSVLVNTNGIADPNLIAVGENLVIRSWSEAVATTPAPATAPMPTTTAAAPPLSGAALAVKTALDQVGKPYAWAGAGPSDFDCSGLVMYAWEQAGIDLPHYSVSQYQDTTRIGESELEPGDLVFYDAGDGAQPGHVTIYIGGGQVVTADQPGTEVRVESLTWDGPPMGFGRVH